MADNDLTDEAREEIAAILETIARDGLPGPRDLDVALDAIFGHIAALVAEARREGAAAMRERAAALLDSEAVALEDWARRHPQIQDSEPDYWREQHARHIRAENMALAIRALPLEDTTDA